MKKARIMLGAVAAFALVGGVLATQANNNRLTKFIYTRANPTINLCTVKLDGFTLTPSTTTQTRVGTIYATTTTGACPATVPYYTAD